MMTPRTSEILWRPVLSLMLLLLVASLLAGCYTETIVIKRPFEDLRALADDKPSSDPDARRERAMAPRGWAVLLDTFTGPDRLREAYSTATRVREAGNLADVWFSDDGENAYIYVGRFANRDSDLAKQTLSDTRKVRVSGERPYRSVQLKPIVGSRGGGGDLDLAQHSGMMTLLVAIYEQDLGRNARRNAEAHAQELVQNGETLAFYYHGQTQSLVTVGLFTRSDLLTTNGIEGYGPRIHEVQERFPHVLIDNELVPSSDANAPRGTMQPTTIVKVP